MAILEEMYPFNVTPFASITHRQSRQQNEVQALLTNSPCLYSPFYFEETSLANAAVQYWKLVRGRSNLRLTRVGVMRGSHFPCFICFRPHKIYLTFLKRITVLIRANNN